MQATEEKIKQLRLEVDRLNEQKGMLEAHKHYTEEVNNHRSRT